MAESEDRRLRDCPQLGFHIQEELKQEFEDTAWENRVKMSEFLRELVRYGIENPEEVLGSDGRE